MLWIFCYVAMETYHFLLPHSWHIKQKWNYKFINIPFQTPTCKISTWQLGPVRKKSIRFSLGESQVQPAAMPHSFAAATLVFHDGDISMDGLHLLKWASLRPCILIVYLFSVTKKDDFLFVFLKLLAHIPPTNSVTEN